MLSESFVTSIMTASITGAGLVIAFYALLARMSDRIFEKRFDDLENLRKDIKQITNTPDAFKKNFEKTTSSLNAIKKEMKAIKTFPKYLGWGVGIDFVLFTFTAIISYVWLIFDTRSEVLILVPFTIALFLFLAVGIIGIYDVAVTMSGYFEKFKNEKEAFEKNITSVQEGGRRIVNEIESIFSNSFIRWARTAVVKVSGITLVPDLVIPNRHNPKFLIEVIAQPSHNILDNLASKYRRIDEEDIKTIIVSAFKDNEDYLAIAETYWDYAIDINNLDKIKQIVEAK